mmetsp:Transcript_18605/g.54528  ORF Transcript_18605/g.54528 Transcript_18605/m.54528 type:complete len:200 (-) Transcript_18605:4795-5394(-)
MGGAEEREDLGCDAGQQVLVPDVALPRIEGGEDVAHVDEPQEEDTGLHDGLGASVVQDEILRPRGDKVQDKVPRKVHVPDVAGRDDFHAAVILVGRKETEHDSHEVEGAHSRVHEEQALVLRLLRVLVVLIGVRGGVHPHLQECKLDRDYQEVPDSAGEEQAVHTSAKGGVAVDHVPGTRRLLSAGAPHPGAEGCEREP